MDRSPSRHKRSAGRSGRHMEFGLVGISLDHAWNKDEQAVDHMMQANPITQSKSSKVEASTGRKS